MALHWTDFRRGFDEIIQSYRDSEVLSEGGVDSEINESY